MTPVTRPDLASCTCPVCGQVSWHPTDIREGYCAACRDWTRDCTCDWQRTDSYSRYCRAATHTACPIHGLGAGT